MGKGGYDRAQPYMSPLPRSSRASRGRSRTASKSEVSGISGFGSDPSGGCETVIQGKGGRGGKRGLAASASNKSKVVGVAQCSAPDNTAGSSRLISL
nr:unnamed protein product [Haemonchus contortus]